MVERLLLLKNDDLNDKSNRMTKSQSFNTDDDDSITPTDLQQTEEKNSISSKYDNNFSGLDEAKRSLLSLNSPSIDSVNDPEGSISDIQISEKTKKKKQRRVENIEQRKSLIKTHPWYTKIDLTKPILFLFFLFLIYLMWIKRDVWIPRLLTSNNRFRQTTIRNEEKLNDKDLTIIKNSSILSSNQDNIIDYNNDQSSLEDDDDEDSTTSNKQNSQKLNLRTRRNKMSFTRDRQTKTNRHSKDKIIDDDDDEDSIESKKIRESVFPSSIHSSKKHHHHHHVRSDQSYEQKTKSSKNGKSNLILRSHDDIVEQLNKLIKSHGKNRDLSTILTQTTGLNKSKINRFIYQKDFSVISLDLLISILNSFDSTILIVPK